MLTMARRRPRKSEAEPITEVIHSALNAAGMKDQARRFRIVQIYDSAVGKIIAKRSHPIAFSRGVLTVKSQSTAWQNELTFLKTDMMARLNEVLGTEIIQDIRVVAGNRYQDPEPPVPAETPGEWCFTKDHPDDITEIESTVASVEDIDVRESLRKVMLIAARRNRYLDNEQSEK